MKPWRVLLAAAMFVVSVLPEPIHAEDARADWQALLGQVYEAYQAGRYADGIKLAERAYQLAQQAFGPKDPDTLASMNNLAELYSRQGLYDNADKILLPALSIAREVLGEYHPGTISITNNLASLYTNLGRYGDAEKLSSKALELSREALGARR